MDSFGYADGPETKRKVRKGTRSCWECKRRKMKCTLDPLDPHNTVCNGCRRRGSRCVNQEQPEDAAFSVSHSTRDSSLDGRRATAGILTPVSSSIESSPSLAYQHNRSDASELWSLRSSLGAPSSSHGKHEGLSRFLHQSLPSRQDIEMICTASRHPFPPVLAHEILTVPYATLQQTGLETSDRLLDIPGPDLHPVLIVRYMLQVAIFLQHLHPRTHELKGLSESPKTIQERLANLAVSLVTTNDDLLGSIEGLECIMTEGMYQVNAGNLRRAWISGRRAISVAQLMGLDLERPDHQPHFRVLDPGTKCHPQYMWFRILFLDRHLSLMLGLPPQGPSSPRTLSSAAMLSGDTPTGRLERVHCALASEILERNRSGFMSQSLELTQSIDAELQRAAKSLPSKWWLPPNLDNVASSDSTALFWDTRRLFAQVIHYNILNQLFLPYMLHCSSAAEQSRDYFKLTCVNASREVLSRFITLRSFNRIAYSWNCRIVDFLALMAALTLLLAHLDSRRSPGKGHNLFAHQYLTDRAMIEQAQEHMEEVNLLNPADAFSAQSADLLRQLLALEHETADGQINSAERVSVHETIRKENMQSTQDEAMVSVHIPYFGTIKIAREGVSKKGATVPSATSTTMSGATSRSEQVAVSMPPSSELVTAANDGVDYDNASLGTSGSIYNAPSTYLTQQTGTDWFDSFLQHDEYPDLAADGADWAFQGVNTAFFDSLMSNSGSEER